MKYPGHPGDRAARAGRSLRWPVLALLLCACALGCRHKVQAFMAPHALAPIELEAIPSDVDQLMIATIPLPDLGPFPLPPPPPPVQRRRPVPPREETPTVPPVEQAPSDLALGSLSTGTGAAPQIQQQAQQMIASIMKRIAALSTRTAQAEARDVSKVRNFLKQAQDALSTGDLDGAKILTAKAAVLMDDLEKR